MSLLLRKSVESLNEKERSDYATAFSRIMEISLQEPSDNRGFYHIAGHHGWPDFWCWHHLVRDKQELPSRPLRLFFPWHRAYLKVLEERLQDVVNDVCIPYWDWTSDISRKKGIPTLFTDNEIGGKPNPLLSTILPPTIPKDRLPTGTPTPPTTWRSPGPNSNLPTKAEVSFSLTKNDFEDAELIIENILHDRMHGWCGGTMASVPTAAYDIIFFSHHCMIDRIWYFWQKRYGNSSGLEDLLDEPLPPFDFTVNKVLDIHQLGYDYAVGSATIELR